MDQLIWDFEARENARSRVSQGVYKAHRRRALAPDAKAHPLRKARLTFSRDGLTLDELAARSTVAVSVIQDIEANDAPASDATWLRLSRALGVPRHHIDPHFVYVAS
jgi:ribosome-binding protein aMBF1 (putative translation factor)